MKNQENRIRRYSCFILYCAGTFLGSFAASATDNAALISVSIPAGTQITPRTMFTETWTIQNTGTTTWSAGSSGYTLNMVGLDTLGAIPFFANSGGTYPPSALIGSGKSVAPGAQATFSMMFIAPEATGSYTDTFQMNGTNNFGPLFTVQIVVPKGGSTNQYDRARAVSYANNYAGYVVRDGYFWTNSGNYFFYGTNFAPVPASFLGDDCAHFVSSCIGQQASLRGGGINIPSRVTPTYGEPGAGALVNTCLIAPGYAKEVFSLSQMAPGDVVGWNWEGNTNIASLDHVTLYLGNSLLASHAVSALDVSANTYFQAVTTNWVWHLIHIFDAPTLTAAKVGGKVVLSWGTNWAGYVLQSSTSLAAGAAWNKVTNTPKAVGALNLVTNAASQNALFYRLELP